MATCSLVDSLVEPIVENNHKQTNTFMYKKIVQRYVDGKKKSSERVENHDTPYERACHIKTIQNTKKNK